MLELIAIICGLVLCFYVPYEAGKVRSGWVRKRFKGSPEEFRAAYLKQLKVPMIIGLVIGPVDIALAPLDQESGEWVFKLLGAAIWLAVAAISYSTRARLARLAA